MRRILPLPLFVVAVFAASFLARAKLGPPPAAPPAPDGPPRRIVSMAPSITETLFALGLGDRVVGTTSYCNHPPEAREKPRIGGFHDPNFEAVVALRPDLVVTLVEQQSARDALAILGIPVATVSHQTIDGILESIPALGDACGVQPRAEALAGELRARLARIARRTAGLRRPRVLIVVGRDLGAGRPSNVVVAGADGHLDRIVELAGGRNALQAAAARFPVVSTEGILSIDPEVILDVVPEQAAAQWGEAALRDDWAALGRVEAVRGGRVYLVADDHATIPGPAVVHTVERIARLIHPEAAWD